MKALFFTFLAGTFLSASAFAGKCEIHYERTACPGQEAISYKKCKGEKACTKTKRARDVQGCQKLAAKACSNSRLEITKSKAITAKFDGQAIKSPEGKDNFCAEDRPDFNKCG